MELVRKLLSSRVAQNRVLGIESGPSTHLEIPIFLLRKRDRKAIDPRKCYRPRRQVLSRKFNYLDHLTLTEHNHNPGGLKDIGLIFDTHGLSPIMKLPFLARDVPGDEEEEAGTEETALEAKEWDKPFCGQVLHSTGTVPEFQAIYIPCIACCNMDPRYLRYHEAWES